MFTLSQFPLPYTYDGLAPYMSEQTLALHHGKHVATYIKNLNELIQDTPYESVSLYEIINTSASDDNNPNAQKIFNNAAQVFNHCLDDFFYLRFRPVHCHNLTPLICQVPPRPFW